MAESLLRTFISVSLPKEIVNIKKMLQSTIDSKGVEIKWVRNGNMHLTLKFIGHTPDSSVDDINKTLKSVTEDFSSISLSIVGSGCFPRPERARTLWVGITGEIDKLDDFVDAINISLEPFGFPIQERKFIPNVTLARIKYPQKHTPDVTQFLNTTFAELPMKISRINLMSSQLFSKGAVYTILGTHFLVSKA